MVFFEICTFECVCLFPFAIRRRDRYQVVEQYTLWMSWNSIRYGCRGTAMEALS